MCGICIAVLFSFSNKRRDEISNFHITDETSEQLRRRGPDLLNSECINHSESIHLRINSSVLHIRGKSVACQPFKDDHGNILLWNGEIFGGNLYTANDTSDTVILSDALSKCCNVEDVTQVFSGLRGPYAFVYYQTHANKLWFGRDVLGRRSLILNTTSSLLVLSSVAINGFAFEELPSNGIYCLDLRASEEKAMAVIHCHPWSHTLSGTSSIHHSPGTVFGNWCCDVILSDLMVKSPVTVKINRSLPEHSDLLDDAPSDDGFLRFLNDPRFQKAVDDLEQVLSRAIELRVKNILSRCKDCASKTDAGIPCCHPLIAILFSGGLDSTIIAALADRFIPEEVPIDLLNVAFECAKPDNRKKKAVQSKLRETHYDVPDRITGQGSLMELKRLNNRRRWNFVEIDVPVPEFQAERGNSINGLICPALTVLDDSIGSALWFAARGKGKIADEGDTHSYTSPSRVLLAGMGADELLGGYSRHRRIFDRQGWDGVNDELTLELNRISSRNLGRDDRIISDHGREVRHPFLDENVITFMNQLPIWIKTDLRFGRGIGEKLLLRLLAVKLGLATTSSLEKRAIQFGSRIAHCEGHKTKGSTPLDHLLQMKQTL